MPLLGALALALVGYVALPRLMGATQGWNHAGNGAAATCLVLVCVPETAAARSEEPQSQPLAISAGLSVTP